MPNFHNFLKQAGIDSLIDSERVNILIRMNTTTVTIVSAIGAYDCRIENASKFSYDAPDGIFVSDNDFVIIGYKNHNVYPDLPISVGSRIYISSTKEMLNIYYIDNSFSNCIIGLGKLEI